MCGRFTLKTDAKALKEQFQVDCPNDLVFERYNIAPSQTIPVIRVEDNEKVLTMLSWGLLPFWSKDPKHAARPINARIESVAEKPTFRKSFRSQHCLMLVSGFYEWDQSSKPKQPYYFYLKEKPLLAFAGLWDRWISREGEVVETCCLLTQQAHRPLKDIHDRMPVILRAEDYDSWLRCEPGNFVQRSISALDFYPVSTSVNSGRIDEPSLIAPLTGH